MDQREELYRNGMLDRLAQPKMERNPPDASSPLAQFIARQQNDNSAERHADDLAIDNFVGAMRAKMAASRGKGRSGWLQCPVERLQAMLNEHLKKGDPVDVANFAMMLWNRGSTTNSPAFERCDECAGSGHVGPDSDPRELPCEVCCGAGSIPAILQPPAPMDGDLILKLWRDCGHAVNDGNAIKFARAVLAAQHTNTGS